MDVLLDTNAVLANGIDGAAFKALREYLRKTRSTLLIPSVVLEELCAQRRMQIQKLEQDIERVHKDLRRLFPGVTAKAPVVDAGVALNAYREQVLGSAEKVEILENSRDDLKELVRRLVGRIPPSSPRGEEARDVLVWLALLAASRKRRVAFVSGDRRAFFKDEKLRPELINDLAGFESNVEAFSHLDELLRVHSVHSSFINRRWLEEQIDTRQVSRAIEHFVDEHGGLFSRQVEDKGEATGYVSLIQLVEREVEDYFVSDLAQNALYVSVTLWAELEVEVEYESRTELRDFSVREAPTLAFLYVYPCVRLQLQLEVVRGKLASAVVGTMESA